MYTGAGVVIKVHVCRVEGVGVASIVGSEMIPLRRNVFSESVQTDIDHYTLTPVPRPRQRDRIVLGHG